MKRAAIYMRVSTTEQEKEETIKNQEMELLKRVEEDGNTLSPDCIYQDDGWSGTILERPALDKMRADAADGNFEVIYAYDRGRLARRFVYQEIILDGLRAARVEFISLHDINGDSHEERLMGGVMGIFHEYERLKITERMRIGKVRKVNENNPDPQPEDENELRRARRNKLQRIIDLGKDPWGSRFDDRSLIGDIRERQAEIKYTKEDF